ncbi:hypothetical protein GCM10009007_03410 [Formosimonas limnophila]|uniref:Uncharacterized protein n=1 Tax=Formosimonas limnophila TaxID=1384487 RepID=A0A8J3CM00_9BURK|nr:hypothetical protein [Formosimonas limnophila]GHA66264.1 hypothetical protein GCM10009007_03410 [Formosimonas limnophila]
MTVIRKDYLIQSDRYRQPTVMNPPLGQRAENARHAIWHFAELIAIDVAVGVTWDELDGRSKIAQWRTIEAYAVCQPLVGGDGLNESLYEGERTEAAIIVHIDNEDPRNLALASTYSDIFPNGIYLGGLDSVSSHPQIGFPTIINFDGQKWKPRHTARLNKAGDETHPAMNGAYRSECYLWRDNHQEMQAGFGDGLTDL